MLKLLITVCVLVCYRSLKDEFDSYQASVKQKVDPAAAPSAPTQDAVCQICHKTKFADGIGHKCHYCGVRSCARCGGKIALRSNKVSIFLKMLHFLVNSVET